MGSDTQTLTYDAASRITGTTHTNPANNRNYAYDALDRLTNQSDSVSYRVWDYDANGNRISEQSGATVYPYTIDTNSNRLLTVAGPVAKTYTYDAAGNPLGDGTRTFIWDATGRLVETSIGGNATQYLHNAIGERVNKGSSGSSQTLFLFDPAGRLVGDYLENLATPQTDDWLLQQETVWFGDIPVAVIKPGSQPTDPVQVYMIHADHLNTPRLIVDSTNTAVWSWLNQNAFGINQSNEDPDGDSNLFEYNLRFAGQYFDNETGLHYNYFRDYEPATGRYLSSDPIGLAGGLNTYGHALQNPLTHIDPTGEAPPIIAGVVAAAQTACRVITSAIPKLISRFLKKGDKETTVQQGRKLGDKIKNQRGAVGDSPPKLKRIHSDKTLNAPENRGGLEYHRSRSTKDITDSLKPGQNEELRTKPDGRVINGNTRIKVLEERGFDINSLPREVIK